MISVKVGSRVDQPGEVKNNAVSQGSSNEESSPEVFTPVANGNLSRENIAHVQGEPRVALPLEGNNRVGLQVREIHFASSLNNIGVLLDEQPTHVGKEKPTGSVVGVSVGLRKFVVNSVVTSPVPDATLVGNRIQEHKKNADTPVRFIRSMRP